MLSCSEIDAWDAGALDDLREQMSRRAQSYVGLEGALADASNIPSWIGEGADSARLSFDRLSNEISDLSATVGALVEMLTSVADSVRALQQALDSARKVAESNDLEIVDPGTVQDGPAAAVKDAMLAAMSPTAAVMAKAARDATRAELQLQVDQIRATATDLESESPRVC